MSSIPSWIFQHCAFSEFAIPNGVKDIDRGVFAGCKNLTNVSIPGSVNSIGGNAFLSCEKLTDILIPNSVTSIGDYAFENCTGLKHISIPSSVTSIEKGSFKNCKNLTTVDFVSGEGNNTTGRGFHLGEGVFEGCTSLQNINMPASFLLNI